MLFPPEIIEYCSENYFTRIRNRSKTIYWLLLAFVVLAIASLPLIYVDISTQSRGVIRTPVENILIQPGVYGEVVTYFMKENKRVQAGDTLLQLNTERLDEQILLERQKWDENTAFSQDILLLLNHKSAQLCTPKYRSEYKQYLSKYKELNMYVTFLKRDLEADRLLYEKHAISEFEYLQKQSSYDKALGQQESYKAECLSTWQAEQTRLLLENQVLESNIKQLEKEKRQYLITAPVSGSLLQVAGIQNGNFIAPNQVLAYISAVDSLLAECYIFPADIGFLQKGQKVSLQLDAFNYREWGLIQAEVTEILDDVVAIDNKPMFRIRCHLHTTCLELKNGYKGCVKKGLTFTARFHLNRRSLWQLIFDKVDDWMNPKIIKDKASVT